MHGRFLKVQYIQFRLYPFPVGYDYHCRLSTLDMKMYFNVLCLIRTVHLFRVL